MAHLSVARTDDYELAVSAVKALNEAHTPDRLRDGLVELQSTDMPLNLGSLRAILSSRHG